MEMLGPAWPEGPEYQDQTGPKAFEFRFRVTRLKRVLYYMEMPKTGDVLFLEHQKSVLHQI
mgnify:CR=1 FL=1